MPQHSFTKIAVIRKLPNGKYRVMSEKGKNLGTYTSREQAEKRLKQVEMFKHMKKKKASKNDEPKDLSYSSIMRNLKDDEEARLYFLCLYKKIFDKLLLSGEDDIADKTLPISIILLTKRYGTDVLDD